MKTRNWVTFLSLSLGAACGGASHQADVTAEATPVPVTAGRIAVTATPSMFEAGGVLVARQTAIISSRVMRPIAGVHVDPGDRVRRGQVLVTLESDEADALAARSRAGVEGARAGLRVAASDRAGAEAALNLARVTHERVARLQAERSATVQELDEAVTTLRQAEARLAMTAAQAEVADRTFEAASAASRAADIAQSWSALVAPFDAIVAARHADPGTLAAPGQPLLTLEGTGALQLDVQVDASRAAGLAAGQSAEVRVDGNGVAEWIPGRIVEIARIDPVSHSFLVTVNLEANPAWRSGLFGRARFTGPSSDGLTVPSDAVVERGQLAFVYVVGADNRVRLRLVSLGESTDGRTGVLAGLSDGDRVVLSPSATLADGAPVRVIAGAEPSGVQR